MDIDVTVNLLIESLEDRQYDDAKKHMVNIIAWMRKGGFPPKLESSQIEFLLATLADNLPT